MSFLAVALMAVLADADVSACAARHGRWTRQGDAVGCLAGGKREGVWTVHLPGGQLLESTVWKRGKKDGPAVQYHDNCQVASRGQWLAGLKEGPWIEWSRLGNKLREGPYQKGKRV